MRNRMIAIFDEDGGGDVDFQEFVSGLSAFSSKGNKEEKLRFAFKVYDVDRDGYISNGELFIVLKMMVGTNLKNDQLQQIVDKTIMEADKDHDGKISFEEFMEMVENTDVSMSMTLSMSSSHPMCVMMLTYYRLYLSVAFNVVFVAIFFVHIFGSDMIMIRDDPCILNDQHLINKTICYGGYEPDTRFSESGVGVLDANEGIKCCLYSFGFATVLQRNRPYNRLQVLISCPCYTR